MATYLLTWKPDRWPWDDLADEAERSRRGIVIEHRWNIGNRTSVQEGARFFLLQQGDKGRGIIGGGNIISDEVFTEPHFDKLRESKGDKANYVEVRFNWLIDPLKHPEWRLDANRLLTAGLDEKYLLIQSSGVEILDRIGDKIEALRTGEGSDYIRFPVGTVLRRAELHDSFNGQRQGGISTPSEYPVILLFTSEEGAEFGYLSDGFQVDGTYWYTGEGQVGDMKMTRGNIAIRDSQRNGKELHVFETIKGGRRRYLGKFRYVDHHEALAPDRNGNQRIVIVFELESVTLSGRRVAVDMRDPGKRSRFWTMPLADVRDFASHAAISTPRSKDAKMVVRARADAVRIYVLRRAKGICESCCQAAPFQTLQGRAYLEPHHTSRLADNGPDHPAWVAALCPNCHRRVHFGKDGDEFNKRIAEKVACLEEILSNK
jgi:5-methylcytosine-specific restriction protein A